MTSLEVERKITDNENLVYFVINKSFRGLRRDEDIKQAGRIGLWRACLTFDEAKSSFSTYTVQCIHHEIAKELRFRKKGFGRENVLSLDEPRGYDKEFNRDITLGDMIANV